MVSDVDCGSLDLDLGVFDSWIVGGVGTFQCDT